MFLIAHVMYFYLKQSDFNTKMFFLCTKIYEKIRLFEKSSDFKTALNILFKKYITNVKAESVHCRS